ncbi:MAG: hypothetical protein KC731_33145, partial [Myxococcales bacterium]|nr:hypothetical protein [Myxococcales bacterium]
VGRAIEALDLPAHPCEPDGVFATVHEDREGTAQVVFVINPTQEDVVARVSLGVDAAWEDLLEEGVTQSEEGLLELRLRPRTVRMMGRKGPD